MTTSLFRSMVRFPGVAFLSVFLLLVGAAMASAAAAQHAPAANPAVSATLQQIDATSLSRQGLPGRDRLIHSADNGLLDTEVPAATDCNGAADDVPVATFAETLDAELRRVVLLEGTPAWPALAGYDGPVAAINSLLLRIHARPPPPRHQGAPRTDRA